MFSSSNLYALKIDAILSTEIEIILSLSRYSDAYIFIDQ